MSIMYNIVKDFVGEVFGFNQTINSLSIEKSALFDSYESLKIQIGIALENEASNKAKVEELELILQESNKGIKERNYLPDCFVESKDVYKFGFWLSTKKGNTYLAPIDAGGHLTLTSFLYHIINKANIKPTDDALTVFNKILGAQQTYTTYTYDQDQWGASYAENWTPAICVLNTKTDDCESLACLAVSAFEYYRMIENKFPEAYAFVGTGWYNWKVTTNRFGHGFPCIYIKDTNKTFEENLYIGESTLSFARPAKSLKDMKNIYDLSWGCNSFWHDFRLKPEFHWWTNSTSRKIDEEIIEPSFEEKQKMINKSWGVKS